jgi:hypothetical protein
MKPLRRFFVLLPVVLFQSLSSTAAPVPYDVVFAPTAGLAGTGSLQWDSTIGAITEFVWVFTNPGGTPYVGGMGNSYDTSPASGGGTLGQLVFEMISETNVSPGNCFNSCGSSSGVVSGTGPVDAFALNISGMDSPGGAQYLFVNVVAGVVARGLLTVAPSTVPLPAAAWLLLSGCGAFGAVARRRKRDAV